VFAGFQEEWEEAREHGDAALRIFLATGDTRGQAEALLELGNSEIQSPTGDVGSAERDLQEALKLSASLRDDGFRAKVHNALAHLYAYRIGDAKKAGLHLAAIEESPASLRDPHVRRGFLMLKGYYSLELLADTGAAEGYFAEALALAERIYDPDSLASARYALGFVAYFQERFDDAGGLFEQSATDFATLNRAGLAVESLAMVAECALLRRDIEDFRLVVASMHEPTLARGVEGRQVLVDILDGVDALLRGDVAACHATFGRALKRVDETATKEWPLAHAVHTFYGVVLVVLGESDTGAEHLRQADEFLRDHGLTARLRLKPKLEQSLQATFEAARKAGSS